MLNPLVPAETTLAVVPDDAPTIDKNTLGVAVMLVENSIREDEVGAELTLPL